MEKLEKRLANVQKLDISGVYYSGRVNTFSRYCNEVCSDLREELNVEQSPANLACSYCKTFLHPGNHIVRFQPKHRVNKKVFKLLDQPDLKGMKKHLVDNHKKNKTYAIITCMTCKKRTKLDGFKKPPKPKNVPVVEEPVPELSRKEKKKLKKKASKKRKLEEPDNAGISLPSVDKSPAVTKPNDTPILPKAIKVSEIQATPPTKKAKANDKPMNNSNKPIQNNSKKSMKKNSKLQEMLKKAEKKKEPTGGLQSFLASMNF